MKKLATILTLTLLSGCASATSPAPEPIVGDVYETAEGMTFSNKYPLNEYSSIEDMNDQVIEDAAPMIESMGVRDPKAALLKCCVEFSTEVDGISLNYNRTFTDNHCVVMITAK